MARLLTFPVCSVGYMAEHGPRETLRFWVHSCFQHAMNMSSASGELLTLLSPRYQNLPTAIRLSTPPGWDWRHQAHSRQPITLENNELRGALWRANLSRAPCWRPGTDPRAGPPFAGRAAGSLSVAGEPVVGVLHGARGAKQLATAAGLAARGAQPSLEPRRRKGGVGKRRLGTDWIWRRADAGRRRLPAGLSGVVMAVATSRRDIRPSETIASGNKESASPHDQYQPVLSGACAAGTLFTVNRSFDDCLDSRKVRRRT
jgi:hypothetical protein